MLADSIAVENKALIYNPSYNELTGKGTVNGTRTTPLVLPLRASLPALPAIAAGTQAVTVNGNQTLAAGSYGALTVGNNAMAKAVSRARRVLPKRNATIPRPI